MYFSLLYFSPGTWVVFLVPWCSYMALIFLSHEVMKYWCCLHEFIHEIKSFSITALKIILRLQYLGYATDWYMWISTLVILKHQLHLGFGLQCSVFGNGMNILVMAIGGSGSFPGWYLFLSLLRINISQLRYYIWWTISPVLPVLQGAETWNSAEKWLEKSLMNLFTRMWIFTEFVPPKEKIRTAPVFHVEVQKTGTYGSRCFELRKDS
jgi:hypothetical protein